MTITLIVEIKGGPGSGNWGHAGRPGLVGGSSTATATRPSGVGTGGRAGREYVGTYLGSRVYEVQLDEVTPDTIDEWFELPGNESCGLLYAMEPYSGYPETYLYLSRDVWSESTPGAKFRYTYFDDAGIPQGHESAKTASAAYELMLDAVVEDIGPAVEDSFRLIGGVWLEGAKSLGGMGVLVRLLMRPMIIQLKGGPGSGNWGHAGRPGLVGGSTAAVATMPMGGRAGRALVGRHLGSDVYKVSTAEVMPDRIDGWFEKPGNESCGLLYESASQDRYLYLSRDAWGSATLAKIGAGYGVHFRYTELLKSGRPVGHASFETAREALKHMLSPNKFGGPSYDDAKLVGGVWLESAKALADAGVLMRLLAGEVVQ